MEKQNCAFFVKKRGRQCRMTAAKGSIYCGEHLLHGEQSATNTSSTRKRIPCPLDPSHTIYEDTLKKHLKKCNASPDKKPMPVCYSPNFNSGLLDHQPSPEESLPLSSFPEERIRELTQRIEQAYQAHYSELQMEVLTHPVLDKELSDPTNGPSALKHLMQQSSILGHLKSLGLLTSNDTCFVEFGAGRGKLSECIQKCFETQPDLYTNATSEINSLSQDLALNCEKDTQLSSRDECRPSPDKRPRYDSNVGASNVHFFLIDRASCRRKVDGTNKVANLRGIQYHRLLLDIEHLDLSKVDCLSSSVNVNRIVAVSKHLCGAATDLSLRCLVNTLRENVKLVEGMDKRPPTLKGILVALCCHHRCNWAHFVGREFFEKLGFSSIDFHLLCHMSSWAVCGVRPPKRDRDKDATDIADITDNTDDSASTHKKNTSVETADKGGGSKLDAGPVIAGTERDKMSIDESSSAGMSASANTGEVDDSGSKRSTRWGYIAHPNESIGLKCKRLIDFARLSYLKQNGFNARLVYYVERATSLENVLLIAIPM